MLDALVKIWKFKEVRLKLLFTLGALAVYRLGFMVPLPGVDIGQMMSFSQQARESDFGNLLVSMQMFSGGSISQATLFSLGIMPYISAAIIFQLLGSVYEPLKKLKKEGAAGQQKLQEYTRYTTVALCFFQAVFMLRWIAGQGLVIPGYEGSWLFWVGGTLGLTTGSCFLMWLGEQIDRYGIGNGVSLIITAGIVAGMPGAIGMVITGLQENASGAGSMTPMLALFLGGGFVFVVAGAVLLHMAQRRIPIEQAKHSRGRSVFGGQRAYLPLRVNQGGVMPIIFASSLMMFPGMGIKAVAGWFEEQGEMTGAMGGVKNVIGFLNSDFANMQGFIYVAGFVLMIYFFSFFWTSIQFNPEETATQLRDRGTFIPGLRPGPRTAEYLESVMERLTYAGAGFLAVIATVPILLTQMNVEFMVAQFLGGTGLLICVSVILDFAQRIEAQLMMRSLGGVSAATTTEDGPRGGRIRVDRESIHPEGA